MLRDIISLNVAHCKRCIDHMKGFLFSKLMLAKNDSSLVQMLKVK